MTEPDPQDYDYWYRALAGAKPPMQEANPQCGYYAQKITSGRLPSGATRWPIAIWRDPKGELIAQRGYDNYSERLDPADLWLHCGGNAIDEVTYTTAFALGRFPDDLPPEAYARPKAPAATSDGMERPNKAGSDTEEIADQVAAALATAKTMPEITDEATAGQAQAMRARLLELASSADKAREKEKAPHWDACRTVDGKWMPLVKKARDAADAIRNRIGRFLTDQDRKAREVAREAADRAAAEAAAQASQSATGEPGTVNAPLGTVPEPPALAPTPTPPIVRIKGGSGRAASVRVALVAKIDDHAAFVAAILAGRYGVTVTEDFKGVLREIAQTLVSAGMTDIPGVAVDQERRVQ